MSRLLALQEDMADVHESMDAMLQKLQDESRDFTDEEQSEFDSLEKSLKSLKSRYDREKKLSDYELSLPSVPSAPSHSEPQVVEVGSGITTPKEEKKFGCIGEQLHAVMLASQGLRTDPRLLSLAATGAGEDRDSAGGFLVQHDFATEISNRVYNLGQIISRCRRVPVQGNGLTINLVDETSRATGSRWGGVQAYWRQEGSAPTASRPAFRQVDLPLRKLIGLMYATDELVQDAPAMSSVFNQAFSEELTFAAESAIIRGTGVGQPYGILNSNALISVTRNTASQINTEDIVGSWARAFARGRPNSVWLINQDAEPQLFTMGFDVGNGGVPLYMPPNGLSETPFGTILGRPMIPVEYCTTMGTVGDILLVDLGEYLICEKGTPETASSMHVQFTQAEMTFRIVWRLNGTPMWEAALTPFQGSNTQSPFVAVAT